MADESIVYFDDLLEVPSSGLDKDLNYFYISRPNEVVVTDKDVIISLANLSLIMYSDNAYYDSGWYYKDAGVAAWYNNISGSHIFNTAISGIADAPITWIETLNLLSNGKISTNGEDTPLSAIGGIHLFTATAGAIGAVHGNADNLVIEDSGSSGITILSGATSYSSVYFGDSIDVDVGGILYDHVTNDMYLRTNASTALTLSGSNRLMTNGETTPLVSVGGLHLSISDTGTTVVSGQADDFVIENDGDCGMSIVAGVTSESRITFVRSTAIEAAGFRYYHATDDLYVISGSTIHGVFYGDGSVRLSNTVYTDTATGARTCYISPLGDLGGLSSSRKYKTNIKPLENTSWLYGLEPISFEYKKKVYNKEGQKVRDEKGRETFYNEGDGEKTLGLIAEDVYKLCPEVCGLDEEGNPGYINHHELFAPIIKELQNLKKEIDELKDMT